MFFIIGALMVTFSVLGGFVALGGHILVLWQPFEFIIIGGAAMGAFIIGNPKPVLIKSGKALGLLFKGQKYDKNSYLELLSLQYQIFKLAKAKGALVLENHIENPEESSLFEAFPNVLADKAIVTFFCDYLRLITMGTDNPHEIETLMDEEIETHHEEELQVAGAFQTMADGVPALGIVAAVLGVIHTMGSITEPPEVLGALIGGALVGTFLGVFLAYGFIGPLSTSLRARTEAETKYFHCVKAGLLAYLHGYAPAICAEFARKALLSNVRPTFYEVEEAVAELPSVT